MKIVFISNFFNHHQKPLSDALFSMEEIEYHFLAFTALPDERKKMGYLMDDIPSYVCNVWENNRIWCEGERLLAQADVVIAGSAPESVVQNCLKRNQLVIRYSERPLKNGLQPLKYLPRLIRWHQRNPHNKRIYMLCASAYTAADYRMFFLFQNRAYRWGYFPETKRYEDIKAVLAQKEDRQLLWCGRFLDWKHPDDAIRLAKRLREAGYRFQLKVIGRGEMEAQLYQMVSQWKLEEYVSFCGTMKPEQVRQMMERSGIYLFTSDRKEGWGAVLNEAMNSGCAVVASDEIGSVPYLVKDCENGLIYRSGDMDGLFERVKQLLDDPSQQARLGSAAYQTILDEWNAEVAAERLVKLAYNLLNDSKTELFMDGPCSKVE